MFGISFSEIILIFVIALLIFGPKKIPTIATTIGKFIYSIKAYIDNAKHSIYSHSGFNEIKTTKDDIKNIYDNLRYNLNINQTNTNATNGVYLSEFNNYTTIEALDEAPIYFQPELDFERQRELFDQDNIRQ
ncbi:MAG: twin-arginine translocase TatA/TatE family subunit [Proteobacteria bacterium]|jgi:Tat protein translocase TatB subunit|nr:twin-arginine translocase TatA/TatE family subunit [Pseudomonadota bacterium]